MFIPDPIIPDPDLGFLPIPDPVSKRHRIPDPDPQHCPRYIITDFSNTDDEIYRVRKAQLK
jgi:hypothetical protein